VILYADGRFTKQEEYRRYCGGAEPVYTCRTVSHPEELDGCDWEPPVPATVSHLTCRSGSWRYGDIHYSYVGATLTLSSDCDGRDTYVLRLPDRSASYVVARSSDVSHLGEC